MEVYRLPKWVKTDYDLEVYHSGVKNMKWGNRRYQYKDGSLTPLGRVHYGVGQAKERVATLPTDIKSGVSNKTYGSPRASSINGSGSGLVRKTGANGNIIATNEHGLKSYGAARASSLSSQRIKPKTSMDEDSDVFLTKNSYKDPDLPNVHPEVISRRALKEQGATTRYLNYGFEKEIDEIQDEIYNQGRSYLSRTASRDLQDERIDSLRAQECRAIASGYIESARNSKASSKLYARLQNDPNYAGNAHGISPYLSSTGGERVKNKSRLLDEYTKMYEDDNYRPKRRR